MKANKELITALITGFIIFLAVSVFYAWPVTQGKSLKQFDIAQYKGSAQEIKTYQEKGEQILWTNSMFSGMPAYLVSTKFSGNLFYGVQKLLYSVLPHPASLLLFLMFNFFVLLVCMRIDPWVSVAGGLAFAFSTYFIIILAAGHNAKVDAIIWLPGVFAGMYLAYRRSIWVGAALFGFYFALELKASHPQMTYYFAFLALAFVITEFIGQLIEKNAARFFKASAALVLMAVLAIGGSWSYIKNTSNYAKYSIRGKSEMTSDKENKTAGLDRDYVTQWSNGISETWSFLIPNFKGGESGDISKNKIAMDALKGREKQMVQGMNSYWGDQPFTGGPVYVGAGVFLLFLLSFFFVKDRIKWAMLISGAFLVVVSWGKNVPRFTDFMLDYFPLYNKFRAVASSLIVPEMIVPALAFLMVGALMANPGMFKKNLTLFGKEIKSVTYEKLFLVVSGGLTLVLAGMYVIPGLFNSFFATGEYERIMDQIVRAGIPENVGAEYLSALETARIAIFKADVLRSLLFVVLTGAFVWAYGRFNFHKFILAAGLFLLISFDLISVNRRYLNEKNFESKTETAFRPSVADQAILKNPEIYYRVANLSVSPFLDASTSYYHKSIGGYHGAKLKRYQELIEYAITPELERIYAVFGNAPTQESVENLLSGLHTLNMLNTRFFILNPNSAPLKNPYSYGNAWFPNEIKWVENADEEMSGLLSVNPLNTAVIDKKFVSEVGTLNLSASDSGSAIVLKSYHPEKLVYDVNTNAERLAVFSEVWYPEDWHCYIDGNEVPIIRANYILRAVKIPAGAKSLELSFEPPFHKDELISRIISALLLLLIFGFLIKEAVPYIKNNK
jgi:hypothetical protein